MRRNLLLAATALAVVIPAAAVAQSGAGSEPAWTGSKRAATFVTMPDGVDLAVDFVLPTGWKGTSAAPTKFPVIFRFTPYGRSFLDPRSGTVVVDPFFVERGYALVSADMRGTGASFGWMNLFDARVRNDGKVLVDWIAAQPWSDGNVGMQGGSYEGWSQLAVAAAAPKALKAIVPMHAAWEGFLSRPGGIYSFAFLQVWTALTYHLNRNSVFPGFPIPATTPVVDEDGDGQLSDEIPVDLNGNGWYADDYRWPIDSGPAPQYPDGVTRSHHYLLAAVLEHIHHPAGAPGTYDGETTLRPLRFIDSRRPGDGVTVSDLNWSWFPEVMKSKVAILSLAGWFDPFVTGAFQAAVTARGTNPTRVVARPVYHQGTAPAFSQYLGAEPDARRQTAEDRLETLRWFDHWLKGIDNGIDREPPVKVFVAHAGWRELPSWPAPGAAPVDYYLGQAGTLGATAPVVGAVKRQADLGAYSAWPPRMDATPTLRVDSLIGSQVPGIATFGRNRQFMFGVPEVPPRRDSLERNGFVFTTAPLQRDTDVIGHPVVRIWASSTTPDGDFFFYLEDVGPDGAAVLVTEYQHRAGFNTLRDPDGLIPGNTGIRIGPRLPWHGFRQADYDPRVFAGGKVVEIVTALYPTAWRFRAGHRIRLSVMNADWPTFELNPSLSPSNRPDAPDNTVPTITLHQGGKYRSRIELPILPQAGSKPS